MSKILQIIGESNFEKVRTRIAQILSIELLSQKTLNETALAEELAKPPIEQDPELIRVYELNISAIPDLVYEERYVRPQPTELITAPIINVIFTSAPLNELTTNEDQIGNDKYQVQCYVAAKSKEDENGDKIAALKLQRCLAICRSILMSPNYPYLDFPDFVGDAIASDLSIAAIRDGANDANFTMGGKFDFSVRVGEDVEQVVGLELLQNDTTLRLYDSEKGYVWTTGVLPIETYDLIMQSTANGEVQHTKDGIVIDGVGTFPQTKQDIIPHNAIADPGFRFSRWVKTIGSQVPFDDTATLNYVKMVSTVTLLAEFIVSLIKQLTIAVSGTGTTDPVPGDYDIESGNSQLITAIETDSDYIFEKFDQDGNETTANPGNFTVINNSLVVAYFILKWIQWVFGDAIQKVVDKWYFIDQGINANNVLIKNTQVGTFNGSVWIAIDMTGRTVASYESDGATPTKTSDTRIDVTAGNLYSITTDDGYTAYFNEGDQDCIFFSDGINVIESTLENVVLATFWANKNEFGTSGNIIKGYTKYLNTNTAGITALDVTGGTGIPIPAYGEWKGTFWRNSAIASDYLAFISDGTGVTITNQGYVLFLRNNGSIAIRKGVTGAFLMSSAVGYLDFSTYYEYFIQRNETLNQYFTGAVDAFRLLIKGGAFLTFTVVDTTGGSGTNPATDSTYTTYKYQSFNLTLSTVISHEKKDDIKIDVEDFATVSGAFGVQSIHGLDDGLTDAKGNELEIPKNVVSNSGNTFDGIEKVGIETDATYDDVYAITADANTEITKTANKSSGYVSELKIF